MKDQSKPSPDALRLLFIELRVGLARSAIQAGMMLNGTAAIVVLGFLASLVRAPVGGALRAETSQLKIAAGIFGVGVFVAAITFVNAYVAQGAIALGQQSAFGNGLRRLGLGLIVASLALFLVGLAISLSAIQTI